MYHSTTNFSGIYLPSMLGLHQTLHWSIDLKGKIQFNSFYNYLNFWKELFKTYQLVLSPNKISYITEEETETNLAFMILRSLMGS